MSSALNKRQQARNERMLQDLIKTVPGNDRCADCGARNPGWASWSLGIFLCMRCAALHRKVGTHISKVKSLSMDSWSNEQVDNMKRMGNTASNRLFNPNNARPSIPIDVDEVDGAMERFLRQKYEHKTYMNESRPGTRHNTGSTSSAEDRPPPLPPKPGKRFGFGLRAASSTFPMSRNDKPSPPVSPGLSNFGRDHSPPRVSKASRVFGQHIGSSNDSFDSKLTSLKEMGFSDERRNATVLKGLNGNVDRAVETLIRLGEGKLESSRTHTPAPAAKHDTPNGISIDKTRASTQPSKSTNPFDNLDAVEAQQQPKPPPLLQTQHSTAPSAPYAQAISPSNPYNPFLPPSQSVQFAQPNQTPQSAIEQSFQNLNVSQQPQQLFPNSTGGYGNQGQIQNQSQSAQNPFQHSFTPPPVPQIPSQYSVMTTQAQSYAQPQQAVNPFLRTSRSQVFSSNNHSTNPFNPQPTSPTFGTSQYGQQPYQMQSQQPQYQQIPPQPQQMQGFQPSPSPFAQLMQPNGTSYPPTAGQHFGAQSFVQANQTQAQSQPTFQPQQDQQQYQCQSSLAQQPQAQNFQMQPPQLQQPHNKGSILALYNMPHLAPPRPLQTTESGNNPAMTGLPLAPGPGQSLVAKGRSVTMPVNALTGGSTQGTPGGTASNNSLQNPSLGPGPGSLNPFASAVPNGAGGASVSGNGLPTAAQGGAAPIAGVPSAGGSARHVSHESVNFTGLMDGRHSPDAFAGLSSRFVAR